MYQNKEKTMNTTNKKAKRLEDLIKYAVVDNGNNKFVKAIMEIDEGHRYSLVNEYADKAYSFFGHYAACTGDYCNVNFLMLPEVIESTIRWDEKDEWDPERYKANARQSVLNKYYKAKIKAIYKFRNEVGKRIMAVTTPMIEKNEKILENHPFKWM